MKIRRQNMDANIKSLSRQEALKNKTWYFVSDCPTFLLFLETTPLFHWHLRSVENMHNSLLLVSLTYTRPSLVITLSAVNAGFKVADMTFLIETFLPQHITLL